VGKPDRPALDTLIDVLAARRLNGEAQAKNCSTRTGRSGSTREGSSVAPVKTPSER